MTDPPVSAPTLIEAPACLAFFLPQYHPIPENDIWWGEGFTEWRNVTSATPRFKGHYQPHLPADLGFYDLRVPEVRQRQAEMARKAGIDGFIYYHYWFNGRRLLERPVDDLLNSGEPDLPFCLAWANENWTRAWDGGEDQILVEQKYSLEDDLEHIRSLREALTDPRYITVDGRPLLIVYRSSRIPNSNATTDLWRSEASRWGLPGLYLLRAESFPTETGDPREFGFDASLEFQPFWEHVPSPSISHTLVRGIREADRTLSSRLYSYEKLAENAMRSLRPQYPRWPGVTPGFDNTARRSRGGTVFTGSTPEVYQSWLLHSLREGDQLAREHLEGSRGFVFVNAWNEWAEGNHLEPDLRNGRAYLDATHEAVEEYRKSRPRALNDVGIRGA